MGHVEVLDDPDGMAKSVVKQIIRETHADARGGPSREPGYYKRGTKLHRRVEAVGSRVLAAAREELAAQLAALPAAPKDKDTPDEYGAQRQPLLEAQRRLSGKWHWVVTRSAVVNAFVTPFCPRRVFVNEGLLEALKPTDDELAFLIGHELSHVIHAHGQEEIEAKATTAALQLAVFSMIDPTGVVAAVLTGLVSLWLTSQTFSHSRAAEAQADATGLAICGRACYDLQGSKSFMEKLHQGDAMEKRHASWQDTHPSGPERLAALALQAREFEAEHRADHCAQTQSKLKQGLRIFR